ncbi:hypothetical protein IKF12_03140 [Candidatus Saccharibacteria bacterium]|nr:hypothetical protein [Candidatus Saccharibacteria bacterium]
MNKKGMITPNGVLLKEHENATVVFLTELGYNVELIPKSNLKGVHTPDIRIGRTKWEMKSPKGEGGSLMKNTIQKALRQSQYIIIDLRRTKRHQIKCLRELKREFDNSKSIRRMMVITKTGQILDFKK